jgi:carboxyl-terminal processing protease
MDEQKLPIEAARLRKFPLSALWIISTVVFCVVFAITLAPRAKAQARTEHEAPHQYTSLIRNVFEFIQRNYVREIDPNILFEGAMSGMLDSLEDPYTLFLPESQMSGLSDTTQGTFGGVGLFVSKPARQDGRPNYLEVSAPIEGTPGWRAGINPGDLIIQIDEESTDRLTSEDAVSRLRGRPGTPVNLLIRRGDRLEFPVTIVRDIIEVPTVRYEMIGDIGYLRLLTFTPMTADRARDAITDFRSRGYRGLILDLRNNYGGLVSAAVGITNLFLEGGVVVSTKSRIPGDNQVFYARGRAIVPPDIPLIVLINRGSASSSEIVAGALKDRGRAYLVGERTFGKGSVQQVYPLGRAGFKITTAHYYTPSDASIDRVGIPPDREVRFPSFSDADMGNLNSLINSGRIPDFVLANPDATAAETDALARRLSSEFELDITLLRRLIRSEQNRRLRAPVYDLEYDVQLLEAVNILRQEDINTLIRDTKTLRALQEEALRAEESSLAS